ncbi:glycoside hydrolase family 3 C-terminal domain-containing protein [Streptomyces sp. NBC_00237]|uniref:glycoside hydrolase family 3 N-terminal domain-containing protein n=1 Tax=Streptomyces sp. NBC_00237 TaxID=2975687 RepID=UPI0022582087|nr:glycoside hydrolase family 3 N-terminal domain-containing protein [Streptomyces sp. NBC_00237]MCX5202931.1 glycoside hydrolase family 3 C-terminal domain-containing protein [Streptomyces sp. NBC_00237]
MGDGGVGRRTFLAAMTGSGAAATAAADPAADPAAAETADGAAGGPEAEIRALVGRMTVAEKLGQLQQLAWTGATGPGGSQTASAEQAARKGELGSVLNIFGARHSNALQRIAVEESRLGIPLVFGLDVIHGFWTTFPIPLAQAASFDPEVARVDGEVSAKEARSNGIHWTFSPMMDVTHEPRWGRIAESCGEDPCLTSAFAAAKTRGYQGGDLAAKDRVAACAKHFVAYGGAEGGRDYNTVDVSESRLRNLYLPPFKAALDAGCATVMASFNTLSGIPAHANSHTLTEILKEDWEFDGVVVSDWNGVGELLPHGFAADGADAGRIALTAGVDMEMVSTHLADHGAELLASGRIKEDRLDDAVARVLRLKYALGLFAQPYVEEAEAVPGPTPQTRKAAREVAARSMVLLKNEGEVLPIGPGKAVAVVGPFADSRDMQGTWAGPGGEKFPPVTVLHGMRDGAGRGARVTYGVGATKAADVVVVVVGEGAKLSGEAASRSDLGLPGDQEELIEAVAATGIPFVVVLLNGRPLTVGNWVESASAVLEAWHPGIEGGHAIADVLYGKVNPGGKLPASFPRNVGQVPVHYNHENTGRPYDPKSPGNTYVTGYSDVERTPQFPFGYGLSYTTFEIGTPKASVARIGAGELRRGETFEVEVSVRNVGEVAGDEVVQLYVHDPVASLVQPVRRLRGFERVALGVGEAKVVRFVLGAEDLGFWTNAVDGRFVVEAGRVDLYVGSSSDARSACTIQVD